MPYIKPERRLPLEDAAEWPLNCGELNFMFTTEAVKYWLDGPQNYQRINDILGALEGAKLEFYRRIAVPYEQKKIKENGDVYY